MIPWCGSNEKLYWAPISFLWCLSLPVATLELVDMYVYIKFDTESFTKIYRVPVLVKSKNTDKHFLLVIHIGNLCTS